MRLTLVISSLQAGGAERVLSTLANAWAGRGDYVTVVTDAPAETDHYELVSTVRRISLDTISNSTNPIDKVVRNLVRLMRLRSALVDSEPEAVVAFGSTVNVRTVLAGVGLGLPTLISERTDPRHCPLPLAWRALRRLAYPMAGTLVVQTRSVGEWAAERMSADRVRVIPNPVRLPTSEAPRPPALGHRPTLIAVGRMGDEKGFDMLLTAFAEAGLAEAGWQLAIIGDGQERPVLQAQAEALGLQNHLLMPGIVPDPQQWLLHADVFALSSRFEGFPNALLEAMSCGLPVVAFDCPSGPSEIVSDERTGLLVPHLDVGALSGAIARLAGDEGLRKRLGAAAASEVARRFDLWKVSAEWDTALEDARHSHARGKRR